MSQKTVKNRILLKISGQSLKGSGPYGIDNEYLRTLADKIIQLQKRNYQIAIVVGAGNIFRGENEGQGIDPAVGHYAGMLATMVNSLVFNEIMREQGGQSRVYSAIEMPRFMRTVNKAEVVSALNEGFVAVCAGGTGNPFSTTDLGAVTRALEFNCELVVKCTRVDGIYDKDPEKYPDAKKFDTITAEKALDLGLKIMDQSAIAMAMANKLLLFVCDINTIENFWTDKMQGTRVEV